MDSLLANQFVGQQAGFAAVPPPASELGEGSTMQGGLQHAEQSQQQQQLHNRQHQQQQHYYQPNLHDEEDEYGIDEDDDEYGIDPEDMQDSRSKVTRRKATEKPEGSDQKRQAFSKRKRGIVLKAYQLYKLTDAKVFIFMVNDKGSSWMYATPGFGASLHPTQLRRLRELAGFVAPPKRPTEVMAHPRLDDHDHQVDDRHLYVGSSEPLRLKCDNEVPDGPAMDPTILAARAAAARDRDAQRNMLRRSTSTPNNATATGSTSSTVRMAGGARSAGLQSSGLPGSGMLSPMSSNGMLATLPYNGMLTSIPNSGMYTGASGGGMLGPIMLGPDGGYVSESMMAQTGQPMTQVVNMTHMTSSSTGLGDTMEQTINIPFSQDQSHTNTTQANAALTGQILTDAQGNMYRIVQESLEPGMVMPSTQSSGGCLVSSNTDVLTSGSSMSQPSMVMMQAPQAGSMLTSSAMPHMRPANTSTMGPPATRHPIKVEATDVPVPAMLPLDVNRTNKRRAVDVPAEQGAAMHGQPASPMQPVSRMIQLDCAPGNGPVMLNTGSNSGPVYVQAGSQMATYVTSGQYGPGQLVQMSGPQQHMGGYTMAMPQDVQGFRSYPAGQVMMMAQDGWRPGNMGGQGVTVRQVPEQQQQQM